MGDIIYFERYTKDKGGDFMCLPMKKIQGKTASQLIEEYGNIDTIPIDLKQIVENIGISVLPLDFTELNSKANGKKILGLVLSNHDNAVIYYDKNDSPESQRFTIAHELGHISHNLAEENSNDCKYIDFRTSGTTDISREIDANIFAGELLIPLSKLKQVYMNMEFPSSPALAKVFGVSVKTMEARLKYLGVNYFNGNGEPVVQ